MNLLLQAQTEKTYRSKARHTKQKRAVGAARSCLLTLQRAYLTS
jgi:hypothetical protein